MTPPEARSEILHLWTHLPPNDRRELIATLRSSMNAEQLRTPPKPLPSISEERRAREEFVRRAQQYKVDSYAGRRRRF